jgi:hypothetical protein
MPASYLEEEEEIVPDKTSVADYLDAKGVHSFGKIESTQTITFNFILKDVLVYATGLLLIVALAVGSVFILSISGSSVQDREWARVMLSAIGGALAGYALGQGEQKA